MARIKRDCGDNSDGGLLIRAINEKAEKPNDFGAFVFPFRGDAALYAEQHDRVATQLLNTSWSAVIS